jgi:hypothetical protein
VVPEDLTAVAVDEPDVAPVRAAKSPGRHPVAPLGRIARSTEDGDRAWVEERPQVAHGRRLRDTRIA